MSSTQGQIARISSKLIWRQMTPPSMSALPRKNLAGHELGLELVGMLYTSHD
ncbi:hypothetical protein [Corynebacterium crudilactis]|uniref:hypothetical protein n=1 Tax=Corynebacterium crudilactis TaxID=1652495 RepID=UPI0012FE1657|nr:hypothetical protein [Corynebacterium crudilactis]